MRGIRVSRTRPSFTSSLPRRFAKSTELKTPPAIVQPKACESRYQLDSRNRRESFFHPWVEDRFTKVTSPSENPGKLIVSNRTRYCYRCGDRGSDLTSADCCTSDILAADKACGSAPCLLEGGSSPTPAASSGDCDGILQGNVCCSVRVPSAGGCDRLGDF